MRFDGEGESDVLYAEFNQDSSRVCVGTRTGYSIYSCDPFGLLYAKEGEGTSVMEMLFNTSLVAQVGAGDDPSSSQRCLRMINTKREKEIIRMNYKTPVRAVKMNRTRLVLLLETMIYIYDVKTMKLVHVISSTPANNLGVCALASCKVLGGSSATDAAEPDANNFLAYPGSTEKGDVYVYDTVNLRLMNMIEAHTSGVSALAFNNKGDLLATASSKGTVFRVFSTPSGNKLFELRRGFSSYASISSMCFSDDSRLLAVSSDKPTIHVFKLEAPPQEDTSTWTGYFASSVRAAAGYLPSTMTEVWTQSRAHATATLPTSAPHTASLAGTAEEPIILAVTSDGYLHKFAINMQEGGECEALQRHALDGTKPPAAAAAAAGAAAGEGEGSEGEKGGKSG